jgi:demethylmenaquinone methyltransferase/2-methoxy-6-polyprenyl-1,4-benzoquinol methylase
MQSNEPQQQPRSILRVLQSKDETRAFYDKISGVYDLLAEHSEGPVRQAGLDRLALAPGERVLEIGFGTGHCLVEMARAVGPEGKIFGIDLSEGMRAQAQDRLEKEHLIDRAELSCGDATHLPYPDGTMDAVFMSFTLELFDTPEIPKVLAESKRVLRAGGRIGVVGLTREGKDSLAVEAYEWTHQHFPNLLDCRPIFVRRALEDAGFSIRNATITHMWVPVEIVVAEKIESRAAQ